MVWGGAHGDDGAGGAQVVIFRRPETPEDEAREIGGAVSRAHQTCL